MFNQYLYTKYGVVVNYGCRLDDEGYTGFFYLKDKKHTLDIHLPKGYDTTDDELIKLVEFEMEKN